MKKRSPSVGSGPAGLSAAYYLALEGYKVTIFEAGPVLGGWLRVGIPEYRLPRDILEKEIQHILSLGVEAKTNTALGKDISIKDLKDQGYKVDISCCWMPEGRQPWPFPVKIPRALFKELIS